MVTFWSETSGRRRREVAADVATWVWVAFWSVVAFRIHAANDRFLELGERELRWCGGPAVDEVARQRGQEQLVHGREKPLDFPPALR